MSLLIVIVATVALMIFVNAVYVAAEFSTVAARKTRISHLAGQGNRMAQAMMPIIHDSHMMDKYVAACQLGITLSSLVLGAYGQNVIAVHLVEPLAGCIWIRPLPQPLPTPLPLLASSFSSLSCKSLWANCFQNL